MEIKVFQYRFPFHKPFRTGSGTYRFRTGLLLQLDYEGVRSFGEAAPLPGFSRESLRNLIRWIEQNRRQLRELLSGSMASGGFLPSTDTAQMPASLAFALDSLIAGTLAQQDRLPAEILIDGSVPRRVSVNTTIPIGDPEQSLKLTETLWDEGYRTFKLKMGKKPNNELTLARALRKRYPGCRLRIDANRSWTLPQAYSLLEQLAPLDIEYCEEPLDNPTPENLLKLKHDLGVPLAIDESLIHADHPEALIRDEVADFLIAKPMLIGGFQKFSETIVAAKHHEYKVIVTTTLESGIGRMMTAVLAAVYGSRDHAHGLATGRYLEMDVLSDPDYIDDGEFKITDPRGLPFDLQDWKERPAIKQLDIL